MLGVCIAFLQGFGKLEYSLDLVLDLGEVAAPGVGAFDQGALRRVVQGVLAEGVKIKGTFTVYCIDFKII